jgi:putative heme-binding domain-containing protein
MRHLIMLLGFAALAVVPIATEIHAQTVQAKEPNSGGEIDLSSQDPAIALSRLVAQEGFEVNLFASEQDFPIADPVAINFDARGRLWVSCCPTYPQRLPGEDPHDAIVILEDADGDGRADKHTVFADGLHLPIGFELGHGGAFISAQPNLIFAKDTDGDDVADLREVILHGFGTEDSHHALSAFTWGPEGSLYFQEGTFHHSQIETPYGPVRLVDSGIFRYKPNEFRLEVFVTYNFANPWGHIFDRWGQNFVADASGGSNYFGTAFCGYKPYPKKSKNMKVFTTVVRPTCGAEIVSSRHFPDEAQGNFLVNNCIGFQGIKQHKMIEEESGFTSKEVEPLLYSTDINFRPVDIEFGPDGALYIADWFNPLIGHMQYSLRDARRDHAHGRIWRISYKNRPLLRPENLEALPTPELLERLKAYEDRTRYRTRIELERRGKAEVLPALEQWLATLDKSDPNYEHHRLEALWVYQRFSTVNRELLEAVLTSPEPRARAAATRCVRYWRYYLPDKETLRLLERSIEDDFPRVRLEALVSLSYMSSLDAVRIALKVLDRPTDYYLDYALNETIDTLTDYWKPGIRQGALAADLSPAALAYLVSRVSIAELGDFFRNEAVYLAFLDRHNSTMERRKEGMLGLAALHKTEPVDELFAAMKRVAEGDSGEAAYALSELGELLAQQPQDALRKRRKEISALVTENPVVSIRESAYAALITADGTPEEAWKLAEAQPHGVQELLRGIPRIADGNLRSALFDRVVSILKDSGATAPAPGAQARFVRIELPGRARVLTLAEVEVFQGKRNIARQGKASQSSEAHGGNAMRAIDGNKSAIYGNGGQTHTNEQDNPWWELDLGRMHTIDRITIWNRRERNDGTRLEGFSLKLLDDQRATVFSLEKQPAPDRWTDIEVIGDPAEPLRAAAVDALAAMPAHAAEAFGLFAGFIQNGGNAAAAVRAMLRLPDTAWPAGGLDALSEALAAYIDGTPPNLRTAPVAEDAFALGEKIASRLEATDAARLRTRLERLMPAVITIRPVPHKMIFDRKEFSVEAGAPVEILFENLDIMPHNLVITAPGKMAAVGMAGEAMATQPDADQHGYIPDMPEVLHHTRLVYPGDNQTINFIAPEAPGDYPFVCTFPGHWLIMNGIMHVRPQLSAEEKRAAAKPLASEGGEESGRGFVRLWALEDLLPELEAAQKNRSYARGAQLFEEVGCNKCHVMNGKGLNVGPELTRISEKLKIEDILRSLIHPSERIEPGFETWQVETSDFETHTGFLVSQDDKEVVLRTNVQNPDERTVIPRDKIDSITQTPLSTMPSGLLSTLQKEEIYDLIAYVFNGGNAQAAAFKP